MTRFTSIGMPKKSFVASTNEESGPHRDQPESGPSTAKASNDGQPSAKKRKRRGTRGKVIPEGGEPVAFESTEKKGWSRDPSMAKRAKLSAQHAFERRDKRQNDRTSATTCFACRSVGHPARECPNVLLALEQGEGSAAMLGDGQPAEGDKEQGEVKGNKGMKRKPGKKGGDVVGGKCYRCNGTDHSLHQCSKKVDPKNPTPYATCYICLGTGHLSSLCPSNPGRGVYPNGGSCKVCGSTAHRASDCPDDKRPKEDTRPRRGEVIIGTGTGGMGADEDDFMLNSRENIKDMRENGKGKKKKHAINNNSARAPYKPEEERYVQPEVQVVDTPEKLPAAKPKKKVIAF